MRAGAVCALVAAAAAVLAGCTEVPSTSQPDVVASQGLFPPPEPVDPPERNLLPYQIVQDFLINNAADNDPTHVGARQYLTSGANARWTDERLTVVGAYRVETTERTDTLNVDASVLGTVDATGAYTPVLVGDGNGRGQEFKFQTKQVKLPRYERPQWRIDTLQPGLILTSSRFQQQYQQRSIYFYDATERHLVPDPRYTQLVKPGDLANWLLRTLAVGPRDAVNAAELTELPAQTDPRRVSVQLPDESSAPARISIPGAAQRGVDRLRLATQVATTLAQVAQIGTARLLTIYDGDTKVPIPNHGTTFSVSDLATRSTKAIPDLYYVDEGGGVVNEAGEPLPGRVGNGYYDLTSVALTPGGVKGLLIAGTRGADPARRTLDIGSEATPLAPVPKLAGALSRPAWAPDVHEVWIGAGSALYRVSGKGTARRVPMATASGDPATGTVLAVRFSPEGSRVALVLESTDGDTSAVWVGNVQRGGDTVQVDALSQVTASGIVVTDVAWNDALKLYAIGHDAETGEPGYYEVQCDGSRWSARGTANLPDEPESITVASGHALAVSAAGSIWKQSGGTWTSPGGEEASGTAPVYVE